MAKSRKMFAVHPGEILKSEFMEPMGVSGYELAKALFSRGYMNWYAETGLSALIRHPLGKIFCTAGTVLAQFTE
jgi:hypothetical protein